MRKIIFLCLLVFVGGVHAADGVDAQLRSALGKIVGAEPDRIVPSPIEGVYEVAFGMDIVYVSADGRYLFGGDLHDLQQRRNLTEVSKASVRQPLLEGIDEKEMIIYPAKGEEKHTVTVFTDIDCGYCRKLHQGMQAMNELGITVRYVAYPRAGVGSGSYRKWVNVWCADDRQEAMTIAKANGKIEERQCDNPVKSHIALGGRLGVTGTPAIFTEEGRLLPGYMPPKLLLNRLEEMGG